MVTIYLVFNIINIIFFLGLSLITNEVILDPESSQEPPSHKEVMEMADKRAIQMQSLVKSVVGKLSIP